MGAVLMGEFKWSLNKREMDIIIHALKTSEALWRLDPFYQKQGIIWRNENGPAGMKDSADIAAKLSAELLSAKSRLAGKL